MVIRVISKCQFSCSKHTVGRHLPIHLSSGTDTWFTLTSYMWTEVDCVIFRQKRLSPVHTLPCSFFVLSGQPCFWQRLQHSRPTGVANAAQCRLVLSGWTGWRRKSRVKAAEVSVAAACSSLHSDWYGTLRPSWSQHACCLELASHTFRSLTLVLH